LWKDRYPNLEPKSFEDVLTGVSHRLFYTQRTQLIGDLRTLVDGGFTTDVSQRARMKTNAPDELVDRRTLMNEFQRRSTLLLAGIAVLAVFSLAFGIVQSGTRVHSEGEHEKIIRFYLLPGIQNTLRRRTEAERRGTDRVLAGRCIAPSKPNEAAMRVRYSVTIAVS
jgi:hypothetical protein